MAKMSEETRRQLEDDALQLLEALRTAPGARLLDTIEVAVTRWAKIMLDPNASQDEVMEARHKILGVLEIVKNWGDAATIAKSIASMEIRGALNLKE